MDTVIQYAFEVIHDLGMLSTRRVSLTSSGIPIKNGQHANLPAVFLASEIAVIKIEVHTQRIKPEYQENAMWMESICFGKN